jgi:chromate transporter
VRGAAPSVPFRDAARFWLALGFVNVGGPSGQIAMMHEQLVERRRWIDEERFLHALSFCTLLPGPEAQQLAIYVGWLLHGTPGGLVAGVGFVLPSAFLVGALAWAYAAHGDVAWVSGVFAGLGAGVLGLVGSALLRVGARALSGRIAGALAAASFLAVFLVGVPFPLVVACAAIAGLLALPVSPADDVLPDVAPPAGGRPLRVLALGLAAWWLPLLAVIAWRGPGDTLTTEALFFSGAAVVTFGGAYAVLAFVNQAAVVRFGWLSPADVAAGLGLAESTPGPLIMVLEFVGFLAAYRFPGDLPATLAGVIGAGVAVWATFAPCFLWIFLGAPYVERLRGNRRVSAALAGVTAAVVGVIASLALTFGVNVLFDEVRTMEPVAAPVPVPIVGSLDPFALAVAAVAFLAIHRFRVNAAVVAAACGAVGLVRAVAS